MANTLIQIKRSTANAVPAALSSAELAYSYNSDKLFIGSSDGLQVLAIAGKFFVDQQNTIFNQANAAYNTANTGLSVSAAFSAANAAFLAANSSFANGNTNFTTLQTVSGVANNGWLQANTARSHANAAFANANTTHTLTVASFNAANAAFAAANTKFNSSGGTISGTTTITGDLIVTGNTVTTETSSMNIGDPLIYLAANNRTTDAVDIGWVGTYNVASITLRTGMFRDSTTKEYYVFDSYTADPAQSNHIDPLANGFAVSVLNSAIRTSNLNLGGANAILWIAAAYNAANAAFANANTTHTLTIAAFAAANASFANGNTNFGTTVAAFAAANAAATQATAARNHANAAFANANTTHTLTIASFAAANAAFANGNTTHTLTIASFNAANAAFLKANGSQDAANLTSGTVASARLSGSYTGITGLGTIATGLWQGGTVNVAYGGTGMISFTTNGILYGNATGSIRVTAGGTDGQVLLADPTGTPVFSMLDGGVF